MPKAKAPEDVSSIGFPTDASKPDLTSVRTLIKSVSKLAKALDLSSAAIYRWIKVNRIPGNHIVGVANFYDVELRDLLPLTGSDKSNDNVQYKKPRTVLKALLEVYRGNMTLEDACEQEGIPLISGKLTLTHWGDELPTLYTTLEQLNEKRISLETGMERLHVTKYTLHGLRAKYGYAPGRKVSTRVKPDVGAKKSAQNEAALQVLAGKMTTQEAMDVLGCAYRSIFRYIERLTDVQLNDLTGWPPAFRAALCEEIAKKMPSYAAKWLKFSVESRLFLKDKPKYPETPKNWKNLPLKRLLVGVLLGEAPLEEVAASRGADPTVLADLFTSDLRPLDLTFDEVCGLPLGHQVALAGLLLAVMDRKRRQI